MVVEEVVVVVEEEEEEEGLEARRSPRMQTEGWITARPLRKMCCVP